MQVDVMARHDCLPQNGFASFDPAELLRIMVDKSRRKRNCKRNLSGLPESLNSYRAGDAHEGCPCGRCPGAPKAVRNAPRKKL